MKTIEEIRSAFGESRVAKEVAATLQLSGEKIRVKGSSGSYLQFIASSVFEEVGGTHLFIAEDKEKAAYCFNDLQTLLGEKRVFFFPASYKAPYREEKTDNANVVLRAEVMAKISKSATKVFLVTYPQALTEKVVTKKELQRNTLQISQGEQLSMEFIDELLLSLDFEKVDYVVEPGQFSVRGGIIDIFSFSRDEPYRIEFFDEDVETIRTFDPATQLSTHSLKKAIIVPNIQDKMLEESRQSFFEYIPNSTNIWMVEPEVAAHAVQQEYDKATYAYERLTSPLGHLPPKELYLDHDEFFSQLQHFSLVENSLNPYFSEAKMIQVATRPQPTFNKDFDMLAQHLEEKGELGFKNFILSSNSTQIERLYTIFEDKRKQVSFTPLLANIHEGFIDEELALCCFTDHQIFERYHKFRLKEGFKKNEQAITLKELKSLQKGDYVTHVDHGVGVFSGLEKIDVNGKEQEAIRLIYRDNDILYVSIHSLHRISKYSGKDGTQPKIHKLGSPEWQTKKQKTKKRIKELAFDLIQLYAKRKAQKGFAFSPDSYLQNELEASFIYEDTPDQYQATQDVKKDMESETPMDRLVCGDVGFGKTEVAIRAAFKAVADNKQVAMLVPTTILSFQHYKTFSERLKNFPCKVDYINRFKSAKQNRETLQNLKDGKVDIIIGTHKLVGKQVEFHDLGLLIIDEEQKFGVSVKDKLKTFKSNVDCLTLTATPIPRTLQFSLMGARDMSNIKTPPPNRYPVETILQPLNEEVIRDAVIYETQRGGQVFFVHNRIENIEEVAGMVQRLCPDVRIGIGHGQMEGSKLEAVMLDFMEGLYDVLIATAIVESGIDVPNANTMIINNAQNFGLSDLHQLRGRVGRSNKKAFCYLISPPMHHLSSDARRRMNAIEQFSDLGSGFEISMRDLDIRGAGDILGAEQSGFINDVGYDMYHKILNEAINELKETEFKDLFKGENKAKKFVTDCQFETDLQVLIPDEYVSDITERLNLYKELDELENEEQLQQFESNLRDRFGEIPKETLNLFDTIRARWMAMEIGIEKVVLKFNKLVAYFVSDQQSEYYNSEKFSQVLKYVQANRQCQMKEKNGKLLLSIPDVKGIQQVLREFDRLLVKEEVV